MSVEPGVILLAVVGGAIVALSAVLISLVYFRSILDFSIRLNETALETMQTSEKEDSRQRSIAALAEQVAKLDTTVGNVFGMVMRQQRTVLEQPLQHGQAPPGAPGIRRPWTPEAAEPLPPEGLTGEDTPAPNVGASVRASAFGEPT